MINKIPPKINDTETDLPPMWVYDFDIQRNPTALVVHSCELNYLWKPELTFNEEMNTKMQTWWTNFAKYHDPNGSGSEEDIGVIWPSIEQGSDNP